MIKRTWIVNDDEILRFCIFRLKSMNEFCDKHSDKKFINIRLDKNLSINEKRIYANSLKEVFFSKMILGLFGKRHGKRIHKDKKNV